MPQSVILPPSPKTNEAPVYKPTPYPQRSGADAPSPDIPCYSPVYYRTPTPLRHTSNCQAGTSPKPQIDSPIPGVPDMADILAITPEPPAMKSSRSVKYDDDIVAL